MVHSDPISYVFKKLLVVDFKSSASVSSEISKTLHFFHLTFMNYRIEVYLFHHQYHVSRDIMTVQTSLFHL